VNSRNQSYIIYLLLFIAIVAMVYFNVRQQPNAQGPLTISEIAQQIQAGTITRIVVNDDNSLQVISSRSTGPIDWRLA
jgi:cell division protease FtsH